MEPYALPWPELIAGTLITRYKRFLADVKLESGEIVTAHCPNSGTMKECCDPGRPVYISLHDKPGRKLKYTWELIRMPGSLVGINTLVPNRLVFKSLEAGIIPELAGYEDITREVSIGKHPRVFPEKKESGKTRASSRLDLLLRKGNDEQCFVEIKNCTLVKDRIAYFPDAVTSRGLKHLVELQRLVSSGSRCVMFYLIQRMDADIFKPADHIDPIYGKELRRAVRHGVEILVYDVRIDLERIVLNRNIPYM